MMTADSGLYETLRVERNASAEDIKKAFKNLAKEYHPDKAADETTRKTFEEKFKEVSFLLPVLLKRSPMLIKLAKHQLFTVGPRFCRIVGDSGLNLAKVR